MKTLKSKLVKLLIAVCACAICITAVPAATQNVQAATRKTYVLSKSQEKKALKLVKGTWYTMGGTPYHYKVVFSGKAIKHSLYILISLQISFIVYLNILSLFYSGIKRKTKSGGIAAADTQMHSHLKIIEVKTIETLRHSPVISYRPI